MTSYGTTNEDKLRAQGKTVLKVETKHSSKSARNTPEDDSQGLQLELFFAQRSKVTLMRNLWSEVSLVSGIRGEFFFSAAGSCQRASALLQSVIVRLEGYAGPVRSMNPRYDGFVHIAPAEATWSVPGEGNSKE